MDQFLTATILGLATASILAVAASGLVLTYTTTGIFNFAHGALGMLGAFTYWQLRVDWGWPAPLALLMVLGVLAPLVGAAIEVTIMRGLVDVPETVRVVVTISLLVALLGLGVWVWNPNEAHPLAKFWGNESISVIGTTVTYHELLAFGTAVVLAIGLRLLLYRTRAGIAMRATVDDRPLATLNASRPNRSAMLAWAIGCACAALSGILTAGLIGLTHITLTLLIVNAYAAAMIGRLRNLPMTFLGAVILGLADSYAISYFDETNILLSQLRFVFPAIVLFAVLLIMRQPRPRGHAVTASREIIPRPSWVGALITAVGFVAAGAFLAQILTDFDSVSAARIVALSIIALSLVPLVGYAGHMSLCQMSFAGIGAVIMAHHNNGAGALSTFWDLLFVALVVGAVGALVALPAIRLGGLYFALATAAFAVFLDQWAFKLRTFEVSGHDIKFFESGAVQVERPAISAIDSGGGLLVALSIVFALFYLLVVAVRHSVFGQRLLALKESPAAAATLGMNLTLTKIAVFTLSAAMAGVGGALYGVTLGSVSPDRFVFFESLPLVLLAVVGGIGSAAGALVAGIMLGGLPLITDQWAWMGNFEKILPGTMGIALGRNPNGIAHDLREGFAPLWRSKLGTVVTVAATASVLGLRWTEAITGWAFTLGLAAAILVPGLVLRILDARKARAATVASEAVVPDDVAWEWVGIDRPFTPDDVAALDRALGLETAR
jgi:branched-chain amino acid transport system permease protein